MEASQAIAYGVKQCKPSVVPMYPITPQTHIVEKIADYINDGELKAEMIHADSEFSAISAVLGSSATGVRTFTATASQGLALMHEVLHIIPGMRLPVVMAVANRALSAPINIWNDHQDSISARDTGWIQLYAESSEEAYDSILMAYRIAESKNILLPVMVCVDGFSLSHVYEPVNFLKQSDVDSFVGKFKQNYSHLDTKKPATFGPVGFPDSYMHFRKAEQDAILEAKDIIKQVNKEFGDNFGRKYGDGLVETYNLKGADTAIVAMGSVCGTIRKAIDELKRENIDIGMIKVKTYRPFPTESLKKNIKNIKKLVVVDKDISLGAEGALATDIRNAIFGSSINVKGHIMGLGGKDITVDDIKNIAKGKAKDWVM